MSDEQVERGARVIYDMTAVTGGHIPMEDARLYSQAVIRAALTPTPQVVETVEGPHSRACGARKHEHGPECHQNCPTCAGKDPMTSTPDVDVLAEVLAFAQTQALKHHALSNPGDAQVWFDLIAIIKREATR